MTDLKLIDFPDKKEELDLNQNQQAVVDVLEGLLKAAKNGNIVGLIHAVSLKGMQQIKIGTTGRFSGDLMLGISVCEMLKQKFIDEVKGGGGKR
jgi:hypothetical protein